MVFKSKIKMFFWIICAAAVTACIVVPAVSLDIPAYVCEIAFGCEAFIFLFVIAFKFLINRRNLKNYSEAIINMRKIGVNITALQLEKIVMAGCCFNESGQIVRPDRDGYPMPLKPGHKIILNRKGYPIEIDEHGQPIIEPKQKYSKLTVFISVVGTIAVIGGFVVLCMFLPWVGVPLFFLFLLTLLFGGLYITRRETPDSYIQHQKKRIRPQLKKAHEVILQINDEDIHCFVDSQMHFLHYFIMREGKPRVFIALQATVLPYKGLCLYPGKREVLNVFADRLQNNKTLGNEIYFSHNEVIDYDLIKDIASFCLGVNNNK